ncbi:fatty acid desaturase [Hyphococcus lacteus]|uniref:Fatty acid desaturase n=1 Tax=Hyphococcus lacteus TaxID=3143536 RepID=A0ABV3Z267_9PROT
MSSSVSPAAANPSAKSENLRVSVGSALRESSTSNKSPSIGVNGQAANGECPKKAMLQRISAHCAAFQGAQLHRSITQASLNIALYAGVIAAMFAVVFAGWWPALLVLGPLAGGLLVKLFTIQHDCGHGSYFNSKAANHALGFCISILTFTPYGFWRDAHNRHHASSGDLDRRGIGGVDTLTADEYRALSPANKFLYRFYRHPIVMIAFGSPFYFFVMQRFPLAGPMPFAETYHGMRLGQIWKSVAALNVALVVFYGALSLVLGFGAVAIVFGISVTIAAWAGTWLFFVQHQYEETYWAKRPQWNYAEAAIFGSSHYKLPTPLRWISGNIGLHHIHHLASLIPNYRLMECYRASEDLLSLPVMTIKDSLECARLALWCTAQQKMVSISSLR